MPAVDGVVKGGDGLRRCAWGASTADHVGDHGHEWGRPVVDDVALYERLCLEGFQSEPSWLTILRVAAVRETPVMQWRRHGVDVATAERPGRGSGARALG